MKNDNITKPLSVKLTFFKLNTHQGSHSVSHPMCQSRDMTSNRKKCQSKRHETMTYHNWHIL